MASDRPGAPLSFVIAALFLGLAVWAAQGGSAAWTVGLVLMALVWTSLGLRALIRTRRRG